MFEGEKSFSTGKVTRLETTWQNGPLKRQRSILSTLDEAMRFEEDGSIRGTNIIDLLSRGAYMQMRELTREADETSEVRIIYAPHISTDPDIA